ncbi:unnamed protein product, partial [Polarella glacialis]
HAATNGVRSRRPAHPAPLLNEAIGPWLPSTQGLSAEWCLLLSTEPATAEEAETSVSGLRACVRRTFVDVEPVYAVEQRLRSRSWPRYLASH